VWSSPESFLLDPDGVPSAVAGVPPDYFSGEGQLWGNPLYDWRKMAEDGFFWWRERLAYALELFDGVRIDHFRAFDSYWEIPRGRESAKLGRWRRGPGRPLIRALREVAGERMIIAEDLGDITEGVVKLLEYSGFTGMRIFNFGFLGDENSQNMPHNYPRNCVAYTGTHDNDTLLGFVWGMDAENRRRLFEYCGYEGEDWDAGIRAARRALLASPADTVILPVQDLLLYGSDTRMNTPGTDSANWEFRITSEQLHSLSADYFRRMNTLYARASRPASRIGEDDAAR
jgi:4-alpha-glucanotransferase